MKNANEHLTPMVHSAQNSCFGCGLANPAGLQMEFLVAEDGSVVCLAAVPDRFNGHPGYLHGGIIATLLDETMSKSLRAKGLATMTRQLAIDYLRPVPTVTPLRMEGRVVRSEGRKHWVEARILNSNGTALAKGTGLFIEVRPVGEKPGADSVRPGAA